jgi:DNA polymerase-3 subunit beta
MDYQDGDAYCPTANANEYPTIAKLEGDPRLVIVEGNQLRAGMYATAFAAANDELRPVMNGVYFTSTGSTDANMVASDGHVLMKDTIELDATGSPFGVIIPNKVVKILMNLLDPDDKVHIQISDRTVVVDTMSMTLTFRQTEGPYPKWQTVIPSDFSRSLKVDRKKLISALKAVAPFTSDASNMVTFRIDVGNITLEGADSDFGIGSERRVECSFTEDSKTTDSMSIGFKAKSMITMLSKFACQDIVINLTDPSRAATLEPYKEVDIDLHLFLGLVMPMILNE